MNYKQKRNNAGLSLYTVAKELGITEEKYREVEKKKRQLEGNLVDKFQEIINNAKQILFNRSIRMTDIDRWFKSGEAKETLNKYKYSQKELAKELDLSQGTVVNVLKYGKATDDVKEKIYDFLTNPMNKKIEESIEENIEKNNDIQIENFGERLSALGMSQAEFSKIVNCSQSIISYLITGKQRVSPKSAEAVKRTLEQLEKQAIGEQNTVEVEEAVEVVEEPVVEETLGIKEIDYKALYEELLPRYEEALEKSLKARRQVMLYEKLIEKM